MLAGHFDVWDVFASKAVGSAELTAVFQPSDQLAQPKEGAVAANDPKHKEEQVQPEEEKELLGKLAVLSQHADMTQTPSGLCFV